VSQDKVGEVLLVGVAMAGNDREWMNQVAEMLSKLTSETKVMRLNKKHNRKFIISGDLKTLPKLLIFVEI
jgi:hypothetical protein